MVFESELCVRLLFILLMRSASANSSAPGEDWEPPELNLSSVIGCLEIANTTKEITKRLL